MTSFGRVVYVAKTSLVLSVPFCVLIVTFWFYPDDKPLFSIHKIGPVVSHHSRRTSFCKHRMLGVAIMG